MIIRCDLLIHYLRVLGLPLALSYLILWWARVARSSRNYAYVFNMAIKIATHFWTAALSQLQFAPNMTYHQLVPGLNIFRCEHELWEASPLIYRFLMLGTCISRWTTSEKCATDVVRTSLMGSFVGEIPESWQLLWSNRVMGQPEASTLARDRQDTQVAIFGFRPATPPAI